MSRVSHNHNYNRLPATVTDVTDVPPLARYLRRVYCQLCDTSGIAGLASSVLITPISTRLVSRGGEKNEEGLSSGCRTSAEIRAGEKSRGNLRRRHDESGMRRSTVTRAQPCFLRRLKALLNYQSVIASRNWMLRGKLISTSDRE